MGKSKDMEIQPVKNNTDKQKTYQQLTGKYKKALSNQFYFEGMLIVYAMMEDRLRSMIYHSGGLTNRTAKQFNRKAGTNTKITEIVSSYCKEGENADLSIRTITGKMKIVRCLVKWASIDDAELSDDYLIALKRQYESIDPVAFFDTMNRIQAWLNYRNEVVHSILNKNMDSLNDKLAEKVEEGMKLARELDGYCRIIKKNNRVRKVLGLQNN